MSHHESVREEYDTVVRRRDEHQELSHRAFHKNDFEEAFYQRREVLKRDRRLSDLLDESSDKKRHSDKAQRSMSILQEDDHSPHFLFVDYPDEWDD